MSTTDFLDRFQRVNSRRPCPVCDHTDWCVVEPDPAGAPASAICCRVESRRQWAGAGWFHALRENYHRPGRCARQTRARSYLDLQELERRLRYAHDDFLDHPRSAHIAQDLGVSPRSLRLLGTGLECGTLLFPMRDGHGGLVGARLRSACGHRSVKGGRNGLFLPEHVAPASRLYVAEGPTDTAALLTLGVEAIGRPCATGGTHLVRQLTRRLHTIEVIVVAGPYSHGRSGASALAASLVNGGGPIVRIIEPPGGHKDVCDWVRHGGQACELEKLATDAPIVRLADARRRSR